MLTEAEYDVLRIVAYGVLVLAGLQGRRDLVDVLTERMDRLMEERRMARESENANEGAG